MFHFYFRVVVGILLVLPLGSEALTAAEKVDFTRDIRPILSNNCFHCHGPDEADRQGGGKAGLRLDTEAGALEDLDGHFAVVRGKPKESELVKRILSTDADLLMPPAKTGKKLTTKEIELLQTWIQQGAPFARHWSYRRPQRPAIPAVQREEWCRNAVDRFLLARLEQEKLVPSPAESKAALARRVALDLTGLPPTLAEVDAFVQDSASDSYERYVDRLLQSEAYGEHWARLWLDLARYADSAGYADDPPRTIWAYRDWVIKAFNRNQPFDQFTIEQLAGDMLPQPTNEQLMATAFHRNTLTNNEGGTNDEEYRNIAIVDRVNTTMSVWMGTSITCAQCHSHKYDPITQEEYFKLFAILNNSADADRRDESPLLEFYSPEQQAKRQQLESEIATAEKELVTPSAEKLAAMQRWETELQTPLAWQTLSPVEVKTASGVPAKIREDHAVFVEKSGGTDTYHITLPVKLTQLHALRVEALADDALPSLGPGHSANFVLTKIAAALAPAAKQTGTVGHFVRLELPGKKKILMLAEVQVFKGTENIALQGTAKQISTDFNGPAQLAIDGNTDGHYFNGKSVSHTKEGNDPWWEVDLKQDAPIERIVLWSRTDADFRQLLHGATLQILNAERAVVWSQKIEQELSPSLELSIDDQQQSIPFSLALADHSQEGFPASSVIESGDKRPEGWAIAPQIGQSHSLTLLPAKGVSITEGRLLNVTLEQQSKHANHTLGCFRISVSDDARAAMLAKLPREILAIAQQPKAQRSEKSQQELQRYYLSEVIAETEPLREKLAKAKKQLADMKPSTVPIMRELADKARRKTNIQLRGNFLDLGQEVSPGVPAALSSATVEQWDRLALAKWLVSPENPLTARVVVNRYWENIFGIGLVRTSEEFGSQGELPSHPELLDYLAVEFVESGWNVKQLLKTLVMSAAYQQSSKVTPEQFERDPENRLLARGPRFRLSAETIRDQALAVSGLLSRTMYGPSVRPPRPSSGLSAAFGGGLDWQTSSGADKFRRGIYTEWRRTSPYPSMITFDAPNRETCSLRRGRTNTPLQALVTLNDPVYVEAAQALGRRLAETPGELKEKLAFGFRLCVARAPTEVELTRLEQLFVSAREAYAAQPEQAKKMAEDPLGPIPSGGNAAEYAAWTVVGNVLLNLDEFLMKR
jgi:mono/diheme cytochrome c family protein